MPHDVTTANAWVALRCHALPLRKQRFICGCYVANFLRKHNRRNNGIKLLIKPLVIDQQGLLCRSVPHKKREKKMSCCACIKKFLNYTLVKFIVAFVITLVVLIALLGLLHCLDVLFLKFIHFHYEKGGHYDWVHSIHNIAFILLTAGIITVAWIQLNNLNATGKNDFLLRIDRRYCSEEMVKARVIIHEFYCNYKEKRGKKLPPPNTPEYQAFISEKIKFISEEIKKAGKDKEDSDKFMHLVNFLDFLETAAYFCNQGYILLDALEKLSGASIAWYFQVYKPLIRYRRDKYDKPEWYSEIWTLSEKILKN